MTEKLQNLQILCSPTMRGNAYIYRAEEMRVAIQLCSHVRGDGHCSVLSSLPVLNANHFISSSWNTLYHEMYLSYFYLFHWDILLAHLSSPFLCMFYLIVSRHNSLSQVFLSGPTYLLLFLYIMCISLSLKLRHV